MKYHVIAIVNDRFLSECYEAENEDQAENQMLANTGEVIIIKVVPEDEWQKLLEQVVFKNA